MPATTHPQTVQRDLSQVLSVAAMERAWRNTVRNGLRRQPLKDIHDHLDVHRNLAQFVAAVRADVLSGTYRPQPPEISLLEKRDGIPRRLLIPSPADALVLQAIVDALELALIRGQPHPNAFYARTHTPPSVEDVDDTFAYPWWLLWPEFQSRIWNFIQSHQHVVVTDLANYFDSIPLAGLRNSIAAHGAFNENVLNLLFFVLDSFVWRPHYHPHSGVGLPQLDFDAPRLLAHVYLFKVDAELQARTGGDFVRWMDDINCGVASVGEARELLLGIETLLNSIGVRLNAGKTRILTAQEAVDHFWIQENRALTILKNLIINGSHSQNGRLRLRAKLRKAFRAFQRRPKVGHHEKILKRYYGLAGHLSDDMMVRVVESHLDSSPGLRDTACRYLERLGYSHKRLEIIERFLLSGRILDDASLQSVSRLLIAWRIPPTQRSHLRIRAIVSALSKMGSAPPGNSHPVSGTCCAILVAAKYFPPAQLASLLQQTRTTWMQSGFACRQAAAVLPLLSPHDEGIVRSLVVSAAQPEGLRVLASLQQLRTAKAIDRQLRSYLQHNPAPGFGYPLEKAIVARHVIRSAAPRPDRQAMKATVTSLCNDRFLRRLIVRRQ